MLAQEDLAQVGPLPSAPRPSPAGAVKFGALVALGLAGMAVLSGCTSEPPVSGPESLCSDSVPAPPTVPEHLTDHHDMQYRELAPGTVRIDLIRQTEEDSDGDEDPVALSPFGVYLGSGVFHDTNGNVSLVPELAFGEQLSPEQATRICVDGPWAGDYTIHHQQDGTTQVKGPWTSVTVTRDGDVALVKGPFGQEYRFTEGDGRVALDGPWHSDFTFTRQNGEIRADGPWSFDYTVKQEGNVTRFDGPWTNDFTIERNGDTLRVDGPWSADYTVTRTENSLHVDGPWSADYTATRNGDTVTVEGPWSDDHTIIYKP